MLELRFSTEAEADFRESFDWYEHGQPGLGERFERAIYSMLEKIAANPQYYGRNAEGYRKRRIPVFPFLIVYELNADEVIIYFVAIAHTSRDMTSRYKND